MTTPPDATQALLRHIAATLAYRAAKCCATYPAAAFPGFRADTARAVPWTYSRIWAT